VAATSFFGGEFFGGEFFNTGSVTATKTGTGGIDPGEGRRRIVKPTGLLHLPKKEGRKDVQDRVDEAQQIQAEIAGRLSREFSDESTQAEGVMAREQAQGILDASMAEVDREIGILLRKKLRTDEDEVLLLLLMVAAAA